VRTKKHAIPNEWDCLDHRVPCMNAGMTCLWSRLSGCISAWARCSYSMKAAEEPGHCCRPDLRNAAAPHAWVRFAGPIEYRPDPESHLLSTSFADAGEASCTRCS